ncbi:hypothetical protein [Streptacidiphilus neutrinimicus]|uniref:hypothetical protein n=1 Tax=Streptacidiphilus neutrinimicus TaxID=105420 RepID=UPI0005A9A09E|nr:hypothetical protein [Streptacidiphilus neutrinimicus]
MTAQPAHDVQGIAVAREQIAVAAALPASAQMAFSRELAEASSEEIEKVLTRWWLLVQVAGDPLTAQTAAAVKASTAPGRPATAVLRSLREAD